MSTPFSAGGSRSTTSLSRKRLDHDQQHRDANYRPKSIMKTRKMSNGFINDFPMDEADQYRELTKLNYMVSKLEDRLRIAKVETENAKRDLKNEIEGRKIVDKKLAAAEKENKDLRMKMSSLRVKLGVANANYNVGKHDTEELRKTHQEHQIQIARLEERLAAANKEIQTLKNPLNPEGSEEVKRQIQSDKKETKRLKAEIQSLQELRKIDIEKLSHKEDEIRELESELNKNYRLVDSLQTRLEQETINAQAERASREDFERQNIQLRKEKETFDEQISQFKVKLGITQASKNVNVRQAEHLRRKDEEHQFAVRTLEQKLKMAHIEIERLKAVTTTVGKTANSMEQHRSRFKSHRNSFGMEYTTPRAFNSPSGRSGWSPARSPPGSVQGRSRVSMNSVNSTQSYTIGSNLDKPQKGGRNVKKPGTAT